MNWKDQHSNETDPKRLAPQHTLVVVCRPIRETEDAIELLENVVEVKIRTLLEEDNDCPSAKHPLTLVHSFSGQPLEVIELLEGVCAVTRRMVPTDPRQLTCHSKLAHAYKLARHVKETIAPSEEVVASMLGVQPKKYSNTLSAKCLLTVLYGLREKGIRMMNNVVSLR